MLTAPTISALSALASAADEARHAQGSVAAAVRTARAAGASWSQVGAMLGISKQAAQTRFTPRRAAQSGQRLF